MLKDALLFIEDRLHSSPQASRWTSAIISSRDLVNEVISLGRNKKKVVQTLSPATVQKLGIDDTLELINDLLAKDAIVVISCKSSADFLPLVPFLTERHESTLISESEFGRLFVMLQMNKAEADTLPLQSCIDFVFVEEDYV